MLTSGEKSYCAALMALKRKDYMTASEHFKKAAPYFEHDKEFNLIFETTQLLVDVKKELGRYEKEDSIEIEEIFTDG